MCLGDTGGSRKGRALAELMESGQRGDKDRKGVVQADEMEPLSTNGHTTATPLISTTCGFPKLCQGSNYTCAVPTLCSAWRSQNVIWDGHPMGMAE